MQVISLSLGKTENALLKENGFDPNELTILGPDKTDRNNSVRFVSFRAQLAGRKSIG